MQHWFSPRNCVIGHHVGTSHRAQNGEQVVGRKCSAQVWKFFTSYLNKTQLRRSHLIRKSTSQVSSPCIRKFTQHPPLARPPFDNLSRSMSTLQVKLPVMT